MPTTSAFEFGTKCTVLSSTSEDWDAAPQQLLETMLVQMQAIRSFEEAVLELAGEGLVHGPAHSSIGQEAAAVGSVLALRQDDGVNGTHRGHHQFLAKVLHFLRPDGMTLVDGIKDDEVVRNLKRTLSEVLGLAGGYSGGRGGSMHLQWLDAGALGTNAIVGGGVPLAAGNAWAQRHEADKSGQTSGVTVTYFGDGASNIGSTLETFNLAAAWRLPLCFFIENNGYAVSTSVEEATAESRLAARGPGFGIRSWQVDGMDPLAVYLAQKAAVEHMQAGNGATLIEAQTYRYFHQNGPFPGSAFGYRTKQEEKEWRQRDPLVRLSDEMVARDLVTRQDVEDLTARIQEIMGSVVAELTETDPDSERRCRRIRPALWPDPDSVDEGIRSDLDPNSYQGVRGSETVSSTSESAEGGTTKKLVDAIADVLHYRMDEDEGIVVLGEDVHRLKGGTNGATRGLKEAFPDRVLGTPISENAFTGLAGGLALTGKYRPIVEFMYSDFLFVAADQVFNQIGKARHMFGGQSAMPVVLRSKVAMGAGYGSQHSMDPAGIFATSPGWRIVAPSTPADYVGLMNTALDLEDPVLVLEHVDLYGTTGPVPREPAERIPVGSASVRRSGSDVTVLTYLNMVSVALQVADERSDLDAEVVDLRWLDRASLDWETVETSIKKTNNVLIIEQGPIGTSYGGWLSDEITRRFFDYLDQPIQRVTGREAAPPISRVLESAANADINDVRAGFDVVAFNLGHPTS
ncbi:dehydrogenase E1 component subunit alpha/beta [Micrococcus terreus]|uniref:dehydrogenase E1 component subunit alpha/beta n=1 Tax=Micrococcus terreus TaxID=574650 RepID=UPI00254AFFCC|nr:alpha-ketoacid dehydrogenase subunit alpha/beta [Micrococcus terreus]MDK7701099.1 thiamine pyrophosphate-dependent enzyme [Micrococcus terreus]WOO96857.1 thiamine pyrophosphate-dependent enzyme [Micrococcus terreus]